MNYIKKYNESTEDLPYYEIDKEEYVSLISDEYRLPINRNDEYTITNAIINVNKIVITGLLYHWITIVNSSSVMNLMVY